jgi:nucleotide-binding universal stress UspA family protein
MYEKILVALDGSQHGLKAAQAAIEVAGKFDSELHLLTVTRPYRVSPELLRYLKAEDILGEPKYVMDEMTANIVNEAKQRAAKAGLKKIKTVVREGKPARTIVAYAKNNHIDMIFVGSRGIGEVESTLLGSVSGKVGMLAGCSVTIAR